MVAGRAAILKMTQGVNRELGVADSHKIARGAVDVEGVADAFEPHFGTDVRHVVHGHVCLVAVEMSQCNKKHLVSLRRGSKRGPSPELERVRGRWTNSAGGGQRTTLRALSVYSGGGEGADVDGRSCRGA